MARVRRPLWTSYSDSTSPEAGHIIVDDKPLTEEALGAWRRQVGYVPQHIFLCDDSIAHNIAFGVPPDEVDQERVRTSGADRSPP